MNEFWVQITKLGVEKTNKAFYKKLLFALLGGIFVGLGAASYLKIASYQDFATNSPVNGVLMFLGGTLFCAGLLMCFSLYGTLFTGECVSFGALVSKKINIKQYLINLLAVFIGNYVGCILVATITYASNMYGDHICNALKIADGRFSMDWSDCWKVLLSGILTNVLVVGAVLIWLRFDNKAIAIPIIILLIAVFALAGYQHVVANMYLTSWALFTHWDMGSQVDVGKVFGNCILFSLIGNAIGGSIIPLVMFFVTDKKYRYK